MTSWAPVAVAIPHSAMSSEEISAGVLLLRQIARGRVALTHHAGYAVLSFDGTVLTEHHISVVWRRLCDELAVHRMFHESDHETRRALMRRVPKVAARASEERRSA